MKDHDDDEANEVMLNTRVSRATANALKQRAEEEDRSISAILRRLIADYLKRHKAA